MTLLILEFCDCESDLFLDPVASVSGDWSLIGTARTLKPVVSIRCHDSSVRQDGGVLVHLIIASSAVVDAGRSVRSSSAVVAAGRSVRSSSLGTDTFHNQ